MMHGQRNIR